MYTYGFFIFVNNYSTKKILPITFCNRNKDIIRVKKHLKNISIKAGSRRLNLFDQWLAWQVLDMQVVDLVYRFELIKKSWQLNVNSPL